jgi:hypothetical protein
VLSATAFISMQNNWSSVVEQKAASGFQLDDIMIWVQLSKL